jgi:hypothetical protein
VDNVSKAGNTTKKNVNLPLGIGIGLSVALILTLIGAVVVTSMLSAQQMEVEAMDFGIVPVQFIATFAGATVSMVCIGKMKMQVSLITAGMYLLVLLAANAIFFGGAYSGVGGSTLVVAISGVAAAFVSNGGGKFLKQKPKYKANGKIAQFKRLGK